MFNKKKDKVYISADHRGVALKLYLTEMLNALGYRVVNLGIDNPNEMADFPVITKLVTDAMLADADSRGIIVCGTGAGVQIAANRFRHIRASRCERPQQALDDRNHDDINVLTLSADDLDLEIAFQCAETFLEAPFDNAERRVRRLEMIS
ncbi:MAG: RpiB/LacA/LacB family sugar-phosphate isomerase [Rickettsiales bacterium]|jgi:ribose 5-phosphate isomerase B|nr:RpiB/LacA/LacB family sugar-phosphate isomerase [Rickettsiales bacterium]